MKTKLNPADVIRLEFHPVTEEEDISSRPIDTGVGPFVTVPAHYTAITQEGPIPINRKQFKRLSKQLG